VLIDGEAQRSCVLPATQAAGRDIVTIEGLSPDGSHPLQKAWLTENVAQCGYCQPGQIMTAAALLAKNPSPDDAEIEAAMAGDLCRAGPTTASRKPSAPLPWKRPLPPLPEGEGRW
jgi:isoquinoline 1-oxidoreductase alpha subunit